MLNWSPIIGPGKKTTHWHGNGFQQQKTLPIFANLIIK